MSGDPLDQRWFAVDSEKWAEVVRLLDRAPEPKPRLADLLRERGMFASQAADDAGPCCLAYWMGSPHEPDCFVLDS